MQEPKKIIKIHYEGRNWLHLNDFEDFQDKLDAINQDNLQRIRHILIGKGFRIPIFIWKGTNKILDGHKRIAVLKYLIVKEGYKLEYDGKETMDLPVEYIHAENERDAFVTLLQIKSEFGILDDDVLYEKMNQYEITLPELKNSTRLRLNMGTFEKSFFDPDFVPELDDFDKGLNISDNMDGIEASSKPQHVKCPKCGHKFNLNKK